MFAGSTETIRVIVVDPGLARLFAGLVAGFLLGRIWEKGDPAP